MKGGYLKKVLFVDLTNGNLTETTLEDQVYHSYVGGYGIGVRILYSRLKAGVDALGPKNILGFVVGPFTGTLVPGGSRYSTVAKSPLTGGWGDANSGGQFGPYLKFAGYDGVFFSGISPKPVYLLIDNGKAEVKDATHLWGKDTYVTEDALTTEYGKQSRVTCIGQGGEKTSLIASIMNDHGSAAARSGLGAVMGSKRLKAVVARGSMPVPVFDKPAIEKLRKQQIKSWQESRPNALPFIEEMHKFGTSFIAYSAAHSGDSPVKNWSGIGVVDMPDREGLRAELIATKVEKLGGCWHCPIGCKAILKAGSEGYKYPAGCRRPEYETLASFGVNCVNSDFESMAMANDICNRYGLDTISAGAVISFAIECYENGILTSHDTDGIDLRWGNHRALVAMTEKMAKREGLGDILADGVAVAAKKIGKGAKRYAIHIGGQELGMHDPKLSPSGNAASVARYQLDATPGRHTQGFGPGSLMGHFINAAGLCVFGWGFPATPEGDKRMISLFSAVTGWDWTMSDSLKAGERIATLRHAFNLREGINELNWFVHPRIVGRPPQSTGPLAGVTCAIEAQNYWNLGALDWDPVTAKPSKTKLVNLGLDDVAAELWP